MTLCFVYKVMRDLESALTGGRFLLELISLGFFCRGSPNNHFCQINFDSDQWFQRSRYLEFLPSVHKGNWPGPLAAIFYWIELVSVIYFERSSSDHFYQIIFDSDYRFRREDF